MKESEERALGIILKKIGSEKRLTNSTEVYSEAFNSIFRSLIRHTAVFLAVSLPGFYLMATNFHTQLLPTEMILLLAKARVGVPFSSLLEILIIEFIFELTWEVGHKLPGTVGNAIGIAGGLMIGQVALTAKIISPFIVIVAVLTAVSFSLAPHKELAGSLRLAKYGMIFLSSACGILGFLFGWFLILVHLAELESIKNPYLK